jgi:hypothetical protein
VRGEDAVDERGFELPALHLLVGAPRDLPEHGRKRIRIEAMLEIMGQPGRHPFQDIHEGKGSPNSPG